jgi:hypothetical protein
VEPLKCCIPQSKPVCINIIARCCQKPMEPCQQCSSAVPSPKASGLPLCCVCCTVRGALGPHTPSSSGTRSCSTQSSETTSVPAAAEAEIPATVTMSAAAISRSVLWWSKSNVSYPV